MLTPNPADKIRQLNDDLRHYFITEPGRVPGEFQVLITLGVSALALYQFAELIDKVETFDTFTDDNDPYGEHDFGAVDLAGVRYFWKIDLYEEPDVKDANGEPVVTRVLTIMLASEY